MIPVNILILIANDEKNAFVSKKIKDSGLQCVSVNTLEDAVAESNVKNFHWLLFDDFFRGSEICRLISRMIDCYPSTLHRFIRINTTGSLDNVLDCFTSYTIPDCKEFKLHDSDVQFQALYEMSSDAVVIFDTGGMIDCNKAALRLFGCTDKSQMYKKQPTDFSPEFQSERVASKVLADQYIRNTLEKGSFFFEWVHKRADTGETFPVEILLSKVLVNHHELIQATVRNISQRKFAERELAARYAFERTVARISSLFVNYSNFDTTVNNALEEIGKFTNADRAYVFLFNEQSTFMDNTHEWCSDGVSSQIENLKNLPTNMFPYWMEKLGKLEVIQIADVNVMPEEELAEREILQSQNIKAVLVLPLVIKGKLSGFAGFDNTLVVSEWAGSTLELLQIFSQVVSAAFERQQAEATLKATNQQLYSNEKQLRAINYQLSSSQDNLRIAQRRLSTAMEAGRLAWWTMDVLSGIMEIDERKATMLGYPEGEFKDKRFNETVTYIHNADREKVIQAMNDHLQGKTDVYDVDYRIKANNGSYVWFRDRGTVSLRGRNGNAIQVTGIIIDISAPMKTKQTLIETEERLGSIVNSIDDVVWSIVFGSQMKIIYMSPAVKKVYGRTIDEFVNNNLLWFECIHPDDRSTIATAFSQLESKGFSEVERRIIWPDGSIRWVRDRGWNIYDENGSVIRVDGIISDITSRKIAEEEHLKLEAQLRHSQKMDSIGELAAGIAHEINNPIGFVLSNSETIISYISSLKKMIELYEKNLSKDEILQQRKDFDIEYILGDVDCLLDDNMNGLHRIKEIVASLKDFARIDPGRGFVETNIEDSILKTLVIAKNELKYKIEVDTEFGKISNVQCNAGEMNQVFLNIIVNAAQAIKESNRKDKGHIRIQTYEDEKTVFCEITDDGPGIPKEIQSRIFEPFFTTKDVGKGTGLGLSIAYDIVVNKHNGQLIVRSEAGQGACFKIILPKKHVAKENGDE